MLKCCVLWIFSVSHIPVGLIVSIILQAHNLFLPFFFSLMLNISLSASRCFINTRVGSQWWILELNHQQHSWTPFNLSENVALCYLRERERVKQKHGCWWKTCRVVGKNEPFLRWSPGNLGWVKELKLKLSWVSLRTASLSWAMMDWR